MPTSLRRTRTYVAFTCHSRLRLVLPLGTVEAPSNTAALAAARRRWPAVARLFLRVRTARGVPADVLGRALALDGAAGPLGLPKRGTPDA